MSIKRAAVWACCLVSAIGSTGARANEAEDAFERRVRPLLAAKCWDCHGADEPEGGLNLTSRDPLLRGGKTGPAAVPQKPADSLLIQAIQQQGKLRMPPDGKLTAEEVAVLTEWVAAGLPWPVAKATPGQTAGKKPLVIQASDRQHWAFVPLVEIPRPTVRDQAWPQTSIDSFVLANLESQNRLPTPPADRRALLRRVYQDLNGLPPTWEEYQAFERDPAATKDALAAVVNRLLDSPRYGERWARHWLDVARFADTKDGVLMYGDDRVRPFAYTYRDYVIRALNSDTPYDQFVREQIAADLQEPAVEPWRLAGMGFLTLGRMFDNNVHDVIDDQIDTIARGLLGLTVACARCHDHKYDPVTMSDYYGLYGIFASSELPLELPLAGTVADTPEARDFEQKYGAKRDEIRAFRDEQFQTLTETARRRIGDYLVHVATSKPDPLETAIFFLSLAPEDLRPPITARWRRFLGQAAVSDDPVFGPWQVLLGVDDPQAPVTPEALAAAQAAVAAKPVGVKPGEINPLVAEMVRQAKWTNRTDVARAYGDLLARVYQESQEKKPAAPVASASSSALVPEAADPLSAARAQLLELVVGRDSPPYFPKALTRRYMSRQQTDQYGGKLQELDRMAVQSPHAAPRAMVMGEAESAYEPRIFIRGNPTQLGPRVPRQFLEVLSASDRKPFERGSGRRELADSLSRHPLAVRVLVNRVWMYHFGDPLVSTPSDFGLRTAAPEQLALLNHLSDWFVRNGYSLKKLHREILLSATWQQSVPTSEGAEEARIAPRRQRLSFEAMRDTLLAVSGRLEQRDGGRPVDITDPQSRCRTVFGMVDRQSLPGMFRAFDFASPDTSSERRPRTMVPQQALFALNAPFMLEQAKGLAARPAVVAAASPAAKITELFHVTLLRDPSPDELAACEAFTQRDKDAETQLSTWEQLAQVLLSSNELMYLD